MESDHQETVKELVTYQVKEILERSSDRFSRDHESIDHKTKFEKSNLQLEKYNANREQVRQHVERIIQTNRLIQAGTPVVNIPRTEIPVISFQRLEQATDHSTETKGLLSEQIRIMKENNELQKETNKVLKAMGFELNIDERGISGMMMKYLEQRKIDLKT
jgi:transposase